MTHNRKRSARGATTPRAPEMTGNCRRLVNLIIPQNLSPTTTSSVTFAEFDPTLAQALDIALDDYWQARACQGGRRYVRLLQLCIENALLARERAEPLPPRLPCKAVWHAWVAEHLEACYA